MGPTTSFSLTVVDIDASPTTSGSGAVVLDNTGGAITGLAYFHAPTGPTTDVEIRIPRSPSITYGDGSPVFPESVFLLAKTARVFP